jgi:hypothetical protein
MDLSFLIRWRGLFSAKSESEAVGLAVRKSFTVELILVFLKRADLGMSEVERLRQVGRRGWELSTTTLAPAQSILGKPVF